MVAAVKHADLLAPLLFARRSSPLGRYVQHRPEIVEIVYGRFISANWDAATKIRTALDHVETVTLIGSAIDVPEGVVFDLIDLGSIGPGYRIGLDQPRWLFREGQLALSLWEGVDRIFSVSFSLRTDGSERIGFIGGIQGRRQVNGEEDVLERYRRFTKLAHGSRPRDFIIEVFRIFCRAVGVERILAVSHANHPLKDQNEGFSLVYDDIWMERGGTDNGDGFFTLALTAPTKPADEVPAKKRSQYRKRMAMFNEIEQLLASYLSASTKATRPAAPEIHPVVESSMLDTLLLILAYGCAIVILALTSLMGGTWYGFAIGLAFVHATYWLLKGNLPRHASKPIASVARLRQSPMIVRVSLAMLFLSIAVALDLQLDAGRDLGRVFKLYFIPIFLSSLCLGARVTLIAFAGCLMALNFLHLPPRYSFAVSTWGEIIDLLVFTTMSAFVFLVPRLLLVSIELARIKHAEVTN